MTAKIVNLRTARKRRDREAGRREADANAAKHGESAAVRRVREAETDRWRRMVEGARRDDAEPE